MNYEDFVASIAKPGADILSSLTPEKAQLWHGATGVAGEAGEFLDAVKKHVVYNKPLDRENAIEELGDLEYFLEHVRQLLGVTRDETIAANVAKLRKRYPEGAYTDAQAQARADKTIAASVEYLCWRYDAEQPGGARTVVADAHVSIQKVAELFATHWWDGRHDGEDAMTVIVQRVGHRNVHTVRVHVAMEP